MIVLIGMVLHILRVVHIHFSLLILSGCDSTTTFLNLTINNSSTSSDDVTACDSFDWNGVTYTESGIYIYSLLMSQVVHYNYFEFNYQ